MCLSKAVFKKKPATLLSDFEGGRKQKEWKSQLKASVEVCKLSKYVRNPASQASA